ncbi:MAG TPA: beta-galactosidase GalB [Verrucomicrobiae bacterium]|nr:beta-galactosidase GalB [Verrucomicrobiae bacterium]
MSRIRLVRKFLGIVFLLFLVGPHGVGAATSPRERISLDGNWHFIRGDPAGIGDELSYTNLKPWIVATGVEFTTHPPAARPPGNPGADVAWTQPGFDDHDWQSVNLPHDWAIEGPFEQKYAGETAKLKYWGPVWYRKHFEISKADSGKEIFLDVDGAMSYSEVWLNGRFVGGWPYGYSSFELDLTPFIKFGGANVLAIRLDTPPEASRWYPGAGLYRNVWLVKTGPVQVGHWGTFVTTPKADKQMATVKIQVTVENDLHSNTWAVLENKIYELGADGVSGKEVKILAANASVARPVLDLAADQSETVWAEMTFAQPKLWSLETPNRYVAVTSLLRDGRLLDRYETPFGIRTIQFTATNGFLLNGEHVKIHGVCLHSDLGLLGTAFNLRARQRQLQLLREMGCNAIRTSHNPPEPELLELCDRMGFLVMDEAFDCWAEAKRAGDYHRLFPDWHEPDLRAFIRRDRDHPCVVLWSIGNEVYEQHDADGWRLGQQLAGIVHAEDPTRPVTMALHTVAASTNGFQKAVDVFGFNYKPLDYAAFRTHNPGLPLVGSETVSCVSSRGEYFFPVSDDKKLGRADFQVTSYDVAAPPWGYVPDEEFKAQDRNPFVAGEFVWSGFDYLGEPTPYDHDTTNRLVFTDPAIQAKWDAVLRAGGKIEVPSRSSYFGIFDLCGFRKDRFYLYQSRWRPDFPMAHLVPQDWNWPDRAGKITPVEVYTSGDAAELFLNGKSLGRKKKGPYQYRLRWNEVAYEPGTLKVIAYRNGKKWAADIVKTTGPAVKLLLQADRPIIRADGNDLSFVTLTIEDRNGLMVPQAGNPIHFSIEGPGEIVATGNGDPTSHRSVQSKERNAFNGLCLAIIRGKAGEPGKITVTAQSDGLSTATAIIHSLSP